MNQFAAYINQLRICSQNTQHKTSTTIAKPNECLSKESLLNYSKPETPSTETDLSGDGDAIINDKKVDQSAECIFDEDVIKE